MSDCVDVSLNKNDSESNDGVTTEKAIESTNENDDDKFGDATNSQKKVGFSRPTLKIPSQKTYDKNPYSAHLSNNVLPQRKKSQFVFDHLKDFKQQTINSAKSGLGRGEKAAFVLYNKIKKWSRKWFTHLFLTLILVAYTVGGAISFTAIESPHEDELTESHIEASRLQLVEELNQKLADGIRLKIPHPNMTNADVENWLNVSTPLILEYSKKVIDYHKTQISIKQNNDERKLWTVSNSIVYCATIYTSIGYGHMFPKTTTGRALTIVYALIGIPLFLIALTDFGKLFTRWIKFLWSFVRRFYYTKSCRKVRRKSFAEAHNIYDMLWKQEKGIETYKAGDGADTDTPTSPTISAFEIDDEFNLPISVALIILVAYIFCGAVLYMMFEEWSFFEAFYFIFISMTTVGFGDYVPRNPWFMIGSIVYLVFGLALMSMCINVVQVKLTDTFRKASAKIGATMGLQMNENGSIALTPENFPDINNVTLTPQRAPEVEVLEEPI